ncbi:MAG: glycosyltransferase family 4 protein [Candidatus Kaiserbacteria bacterium]|nr:glycosyltransferase family 4 protein [Candidatus Kaiserbacteria bacterium]
MKIHIYALRFKPKTGGGAHRTLDLMIRAMLARGYDVTLSTFLSGSDEIDMPMKLEQEIFTRGFLPLQFHVARLMAKDSESDIHLIASPTLIWAAGIFGRKNRRALVLAYINTFTIGMGYFKTQTNVLKNRLHIARWWLWEHTLGLYLARGIDRMYFDSPVLQALYARAGYKTHDSVVTPEFMDLTSILRSSAALPNPYESGLRNILYVGRLEHGKGADLILDALVQVPEDIHAHIVGAGAEESALRQKAAHMPGRVHFHGWKSGSELLSFYAHANVFLQPVRWPEPFGRTVAEAMACGCPVIATENTGSAWVAGEGGLTMKKNDAADLAAKIKEALGSDRHAALARAAIERARVFDVANVARDFLDDLERFAKARAL